MSQNDPALPPLIARKHRRRVHPFPLEKGCHSPGQKRPLSLFSEKISWVGQIDGSLIEAHQEFRTRPATCSKGLAPRSGDDPVNSPFPRGFLIIAVPAGNATWGGGAKRARAATELPDGALAGPPHMLGRVSLALGRASNSSVQAATAGGGAISMSGRNSTNGT